ncbi:MAG: OmpH family outer membrane protein [Pirellulaceae bacterium]|nr:OmpH family outer membrane protein [Pirellulaceae bacterium]
MRQFYRVYPIFCFLSVFGLTATPLQSQETKTSGTQVVLIDITKVFKEHAGFNAAMEAMKQEVESFEAYIRQERSKGQKMAEQLKEFKVGSPEYKRLETNIAKLSTDLQVEAQLKRKDFMQREAKVYYDTYLDVQAKVKSFADRNGIDIVQSYSSEPMDLEDRNSVLQGVNQPIVYQKNRDITNFIVRAVTKTAQASSQGQSTQR